MKISIYNRKTGQIEIEKVFGDAFIHLAYGTLFPLFFSPLKRLFSSLLGLYQESRFSKRQIPKFIKNYSIDMTQFEEKNYQTFNDFFIRKFKKNAREFPKDDSFFASFCEARYLVFERNFPSNTYPVKGQFLTSLSLLENTHYASFFEDGPIIIARLAPVDYHRFHFPDDAEIVESYHLSGKLDSVNPYALKRNPSIFCQNERHITIMNTKNFARIALIEVGAMGVGKIVQTNLNSHVKRGDEKGYFIFGGSTVIALLQKDYLTIDRDILTQSEAGIETFLTLGERIGVTKSL